MAHDFSVDRDAIGLDEYVPNARQHCDLEQQGQQQMAAKAGKQPIDARRAVVGFIHRALVKDSPETGTPPCGDALVEVCPSLG